MALDPFSFEERKGIQTLANIGNPQKLGQEIAQESKNPQISPDLAKIAAKNTLDELLGALGRENMAASMPPATPDIGTALDNSLREKIETLMNKGPSQNAMVQQGIRGTSARPPMPQGMPQGMPQQRPPMPQGIMAAQQRPPMMRARGGVIGYDEGGEIGMSGLTNKEEIIGILRNQGISADKIANLSEQDLLKFITDPNMREFMKAKFPNVNLPQTGDQTGGLSTIRSGDTATTIPRGGINSNTPLQNRRVEEARATGQMKRRNKTKVKPKKQVDPVEGLVEDPVEDPVVKPKKQEVVNNKAAGINTIGKAIADPETNAMMVALRKAGGEGINSKQVRDDLSEFMGRQPKYVENRKLIANRQARLNDRLANQDSKLTSDSFRAGLRGFSSAGMGQNPFQQYAVARDKYDINRAKDVEGQQLAIDQQIIAANEKDIQAAGKVLDSTAKVQTAAAQMLSASATWFSNLTATEQTRLNTIAEIAQQNLSDAQTRSLNRATTLLEQANNTREAIEIIETFKRTFIKEALEYQRGSIEEIRKELELVMAGPNGMTERLAALYKEEQIFREEAFDDLGAGITLPSGTRGTTSNLAQTYVNQ
jgi:23S rRNA pseudoU1915 N3-methylase RlmH